MSYNVKYFKEIKGLKGLRKAKASTMGLFCEYTEQLTIFAIKAPS